MNRNTSGMPLNSEEIGHPNFSGMYFLFYMNRSSKEKWNSKPEFLESCKKKKWKDQVNHLKRRLQKHLAVTETDYLAFCLKPCNCTLEYD